MELDEHGWCNVCDEAKTTASIETYISASSVGLCAACLVKALALFPTEDIMRLLIAQRARKEKEDA